MTKSFKRIFAALLVLTMLVGMLASCEIFEGGIVGATEVKISGEEIVTLDVGESLQLEYEANGKVFGKSWRSSADIIAEISEDGLVSAKMAGSAIITLKCGDASDTIVVMVVAPTVDGGNGDGGTGTGGDGSKPDDGGAGGDNSDIGGDTGTDDKDDDTEIPPDKYKNMTAAQFYANYTPAVSYIDAMLRSAEGFMSGDITLPDQEPILSSHMPKRDGKYIRNTSAIFADEGYTYTVVDASGRAVLRVYKGGGYITLEEVAAYVYAFGEVPPNYDSDKDNKYVSSSPKSEWGKYLRLNDSKFSGSTSKYPYEPELPNISGCGGSLQYYEIDIGTTGTDCDPKYDAEIYNNGTRIERGAARIVYVKYNGSRRVTDPNERYVFYTYNHYNDFQEYLNYYGGWGEIFGNITGGGSISSKYDYNPTPYVETLREDFTVVEVVVIPFIFKEETA